MEIEDEIKERLAKGDELKNGYLVRKYKISFDYANGLIEKYNKDNELIGT